MKKNNQKSNKRNSRILLAALLALVMGVTATGVVAFAARWFDQTNKTDNTVKVDRPVTVTIDGAASSGTIMPGVATSKVTTTFGISIEGTAENKYNLVIKDIVYAFDNALIGSNKDNGYFDDKAEFEAIFGEGYADFSGAKDAAAFAAFLKDFKVSFNGGAAAGLAEGMVLSAEVQSVAGLTVSVTADDALQLIARGGTLNFTLALEIA